jgi:DNA-binding response OmpR family regulator
MLGGGGDESEAWPPTARILLVEDDELQAESLAFLLRREGYAVDVAATGAAGLARARGDEPPDAVVLDVWLPDLSGVEVARRLRTISDVPVLMLTARGELSDKIVGLDAGADDYLTKPFVTEELLARLRAALRRIRSARSGSVAPAAVLRVGALRLEVGTRRVMLGGREVAVSAREFDILRLLAEACGRVVRRNQLFAAIWGDSFFGDERALDVYIRAIRRKIEPDPAHPTYLRTVRGIGYRLAEEPAPGDP